MITDFYTNTHSFRRMEHNEIKELEVGDSVTICVYSDMSNKIEFVNATVIRPLFWNNDADEPCWELETTNGFVDAYSVYEVKERITIDVDLEKFRYALIGNGYLKESVVLKSEEDLIEILEDLINRKILSEYYRGKKLKLFD